jgi:hypothetical protein
MEIQFTPSPQNCLWTLRAMLAGTQAATVEKNLSQRLQGEKVTKVTWWRADCP